MVFSIVSSLKEYVDELQEKSKLEKENEKERQEMERNKEEQVLKSFPHYNTCWVSVYLET